MIVKHVCRVARLARLLAYLMAAASALPANESRSDEPATAAKPAANSAPPQTRISADIDDPLPAGALARLGAVRVTVPAA